MYVYKKLLILVDANSSHKKLEYMYSALQVRLNEAAALLPDTYRAATAARQQQRP